MLKVITKRAWTSPVHYLPAETEVEYIEDINDEKVLIRYDGYNYIIDRSCIFDEGE